ncbi:unnamed protein product [Penicillium roqueforti FM164]|uniref:Genomic scaffold, ProqFM164S03 n=1 Tax=Penicillium roqueforti (strain FM164) TaxID=1365484 RepID=W6QB84_PENRF|nr:unnamed protein product [Penicillium roqueforti FM164]
MIRFVLSIAHLVASSAIKVPRLMNTRMATIPECCSPDSP